ncbi:MAG: polyprenyl synthetase family protein [Bacteroidota bacterium]
MHKIKFLQDKINKEVNSLCEELHLEPEDLYDPISYTLSLGGKRMRPVLLLMGCELFGGDIERAVLPALAIELFHNFTLVHDDIMDNAPLRRNHPSVYSKWNSNTAILSGDAMLVKAYQHISKCDRTILPKVLDVFNDAAIKVCEGQQLDMNYEEQDNITVSDYLGMIELKTAVLLASSLQIGASIGGASDEEAQHLYNFGKNIGMAFQLQDDILDVYGDQQKFGKQVGGDIVSNKKTFLLLQAIELAKGEMLNELRTILGTKNFDPWEKVKAVKRIYDQLNIKERTKEKMQYYHWLGLKHLSEVKVAEEKKTVLISFTESLIVREI